MAINLTQEKSPLFAHRQQKYLMAILGLVVIGIVFVVWWGFLREEEVPPVTESAASLIFKKVTINWSLLEDPRLAELNLFEAAPPYEDKVGRENPFISY